MVAPKTTRYRGKIACGVFVPLGIVTAYVGVGLGLLQIVGEPILGTLLLGGIVTTLIGVVRLAWPSWLAYPPEPLPRAEMPVFDRTVVGCGILVFLTGQSLALWLYSVTGSAGFDASVKIRQDAGVVLTLLLVLVAAPVAEETFFRGLLYPLLRRRLGIGASTLLSTVVFGLMHGNMVQLASAVPLAVTWPCCTSASGDSGLARSSTWASTSPLSSSLHRRSRGWSTRSQLSC